MACESPVSVARGNRTAKVVPWFARLTRRMAPPWAHDPQDRRQPQATAVTFVVKFLETGTSSNRPMRLLPVHPALDAPLPATGFSA